MIKKIVLTLIYIHILLIPLFSQAAVLDFRERDLEYRIESLEGEWDFYWKKILTPGVSLPEKTQPISVPGAWNIRGDYPADGYATYHITVLLPDVSYPLGLRTRFSLNQYKMYINGRLLIENGCPGPDNVVNRNRDNLSVRQLPAGQKLEILYQVSNYNDIHGGITDAFEIGSLDTLVRNKNRKVIFEAFLFGVLLITGMLYLSFYLTKKDDRASLYFGLFSIVLGFRTILYGEHLLLLIDPTLPIDLENILGHLTFYLSVPLFLRFITIEYPFKWSRFVFLPVYFISALFICLVLLTEHHFYIQFLIFYQTLALIISAIIFAVIIFYTLKKNASAIVTLSGFLVLLFTAANDIFYAQGLIQTAYIVPVGLALFIISQAALLSWSIGRAFSNAEMLTCELAETNSSFRRFVPEEFLEYMGKDTITEVQLGDHTLIDMTIMFCDIRDFTTLSEHLTPKENFLFLNSYLKRIGPLIRQFGGFIDKYVGDGIMALFPDSADSAVKAAIQIQEEIKVYNSHRGNFGYDPIRIGIGIHTGSLMLGTIGENERMDSTVISDSVNICARIESLTKEYGMNIAISEATWDILQDRESIEERYIGQIYLKGKSAPVPIFEIFNTDSPETLAAKKKLKETFYKALTLYNNENYNEAEKVFKEILTDLPTDKTSQVYLSKSKENG